MKNERNYIISEINKSNSRAKIFGENLESVLKERGVTRKELAEKLNISLVTVGKYINGQREPSLDKIFEIAQFLKVSVVNLIGDNQHSLTPLSIEKRLFDERFCRALALLACANILAEKYDGGFKIEVSLIKKNVVDEVISYVPVIKRYKVDSELSLINIVETSEKNAILRNETFVEVLLRNLDAAA